MKRPETNTEFLTRLIEFSRHGALAQLFVLDAIAKGAERVASADPEEVRKAMAGHLIHPDAWMGVAREIRDEFRARDAT